MHRVVVTTLRNEMITSVDVPTTELDQVVASYAVITNTCIYIDGRLLLPAQRAHFLQAYREQAFARELAQAAPPSPAADPLPSMQQVASWMDIMRRGLEDVGHAYAAVQRAAAQQHQVAAQQQQDMHASMKAVTETYLQMQRDLADEGVRQRKLTAASLGDIDLMHRAVKAAQLNDALAKMKAADGFTPRGGKAQALAHREDRMTVGDVLRGIIDIKE